jgi:hypothetical protein
LTAIHAFPAFINAGSEFNAGLLIVMLLNERSLSDNNLFPDASAGISSLHRNDRLSHEQWSLAIFPKRRENNLLVFPPSTLDWI